jgi:GTP-binding protein
MQLSDLRFLTSAPRVAQLPDDTGSEIVFAGRSNAGKSSAINQLFAQRGLAKVSKQPGRTQAFNVFAFDPSRRVVDLPGYGYAKVPDSVQRRWGQEIPAYFAERQSLAGVVLIMDVRHPFRESDNQFLALTARHPVVVVLSKADKLSKSQQNQRLGEAERHAVALGIDPESLLLFSAQTGQGREGLQSLIMEWLEFDQPNVEREAEE